MFEIINQQLSSDTIFIGLLTVALTELAKRHPKIPLNPKNKDQVKFVVGAISLLYAVGFAIFNHTFSTKEFWPALQTVVHLWLTGWMAAYVGYKTLPFVKKEDETEPVEATTSE